MPRLNSSQRDKIWLGDPNSNSKRYSHVTTSLALCRAIYENGSNNIVTYLNDVLCNMRHGITEISVAEGCLHRYAVAYKPHVQEIYVVFKGTDGWADIFTDLNVFGRPNCFEGRFHDGFYNRAKLIPLAPFFHLLSRFKNHSIIFTGHSLGGAVATIVAIRMLTDMRLPADCLNKIHCI